MSRVASHSVPSQTEAGKIAVRSGHPSIEDLPTELKVNILKRLDTVASLRSLVHASPTFHNSYLLAREEIFTAVTLQNLSSRSIDPFQPCAYLELCLRDRSELNEVLELALTSIRTQKKAQIRARNRGNRTAPIKVAIDDCIALLNLDDILSWDITRYFQTTAFRLLNISTAGVLRAWANQRKHYHGILMRDSPAEMARLMAYYPGRPGPRLNDVLDIIFQDYIRDSSVQLGLLPVHFPSFP